MNNICFFCGDISRGGGTEKITSVIASKLSKYQNYKIYIFDISNEGAKDAYFQFAKNIKIIHIDNSLSFLKKIHALYYYLKKYDINILINVDVMLYVYSLLPTKFLKIKTINWEQFNYYNDIGSKNTKKIRQLALLLGDYYINLTKQDMLVFMKNFKIKSQITYMYNPVEKELNYTYKTDSKIIITAGNFFEMKGYDACVRIGLKVFSKHPDWKWVFCGDGPCMEDIKKMIENSGMKSNFVLKGRTKNLDYEMSQSSIYVSCSKSEGFGLVLIEAQNNGLPIVSFDVPFGPKEIVVDGINGYLIENLNEDEMCKKILYLIENLSIRNKFSEKSHINFGKFDIELIIKKWIDIIENVKR